MDTADALQIVYDLALQNICDEHENPEEYARQMQALGILHDVAVNEYGDD